MFSRFLGSRTVGFKTVGSTVAFFLFFSLAAIPAAASSFDDVSWSTSGSIFYFTSGAGKQDADPAPIHPSLGFSGAWRFSLPLHLELTEDIYFSNYEYNTKLDRPLPCSSENRSAFVIGFLTGIQLTGFFPIGGGGVDARVYGGPAMDLRAVFLAFGLNHPGDLEGDIETNAKLQTDAIRKYLWGKGRWFLPVAGIGIDFPLNENFLIGFDFRAWFPIYRLWADKDIPKIDGWRFGAGLRITPRKKS